MRMKISLALLAALGCTAALANPSVAGAPAQAGTPLSKGEIKAMQQFKMLDFNGDGKVTKADGQALHQRPTSGLAGGRTPPGTKAIKPCSSSGTTRRNARPLRVPGFPA